MTTNVKRAGYLDELFRFGGAATVTVGDTSSATYATDEQTAARLILLSGTLTATRSVVLQPRAAGAEWLLGNATTQVVQVRATASGSSLEIGPGEIIAGVSYDGTNLVPSRYVPSLDESTVCVVDVGAVFVGPKVLNSKQSRASLIFLVGTTDGGGQQLQWGSTSANGKRVTVVNLTDNEWTLTVSSGSARLPAQTIRSYTWSSGSLVDDGVRSTAERSAGRFVRVTTAGAVAAAVDEDVNANVSVTKNGTGDYTVTFTTVPGIGTIKGAQVTPIGTTPVSVAVELVSAKVVRVRMSADSDFTLSVIS